MDSKKSKKSLIIRASEIGQYTFCSIAWRLKKMGYQPDSPLIKQGTDAHYNLGLQLEAFNHSSQLSIVLIKISVILILSGLLGFFGWLLLW